MRTSKLSMTREGGFTGVALTCDVDIASLAPDEARRVEALVEESHILALPASPRRESHGADRFVYRITVEAEGRQQTVKVSDGAIPEGMQPLIDYLLAARRGAAPTIPTSASGGAPGL